ncbi:signal peptide peptidase SppA [Patescibacteria group bacterium]|nr:signal peptide peptidase SppA [Patescibacteria group bacterium]
MKRLIIPILILFVFSGCTLISKRKVQPVATTWIPEFTSKLVKVSYLQRSTTTVNVIAVVPISGEISESSYGDSNMVEDIKLMLRVASNDFRVKAIILKVESPGGEVNASDLIWNEVMKFKKLGKPVVAFYNGIAASGGYYVSAPADKIIITPETWTGSIGVIMYAVDISSKLAKEGVKYTIIKSGRNKDMLSPLKPPTKEALEITQRIIDNSFERFVQKVAQGRRMDEATVRILADGRIFDAKQALDNGLVDQIGYIEDSFEVAKKFARVNDASLIQLESKKSTKVSFFTMLKNKSYGLYYLWIINDLKSK